MIQAKKMHTHTRTHTFQKYQKKAQDDWGGQGCFFFLLGHNNIVGVTNTTRESPARKFQQDAKLTRT